MSEARVEPSYFEIFFEPDHAAVLPTIKSGHGGPSRWRVVGYLSQALTHASEWLDHLGTDPYAKDVDTFVDQIMMFQAMLSRRTTDQLTRHDLDKYDVLQDHYDEIAHTMEQVMPRKLPRRT